MVSEVKDLCAGVDMKQFECCHHAFELRYWSWKEIPETKMDAIVVYITVT